MFVDGVTVEMSRSPARKRVGDFHEPDHNNWLALNQFTVAEGQHAGRPTWCS
jgi:type I restriction enzyme R subunit